MGLSSNMEDIGRRIDKLLVEQGSLAEGSISNIGDVNKEREN